MTVGVIGTGRMGLAIARAVAATGEPVLVCSARVPDPSPPDPSTCYARVTLNDVWRRAELVLFAVPFPVALGLVCGPAGRCGGGRTLVDATNPSLCPGAVVPPGRSGGELIAEAASGWRVAKAFNTVPADQVAACRLDGGPVAVPVAGADAAKTEVFALARRLGFEPLDAGDIAGSRELEALAVLLARVSRAHRLHGRVAIRIGQPDRPPSDSRSAVAGLAQLDSTVTSRSGAAR